MKTFSRFLRPLLLSWICFALHAQSYAAETALNCDGVQTAYAGCASPEPGVGLTVETWFKWGHSGSSADGLFFGEAGSPGGPFWEVSLGGDAGPNAVRFIPIPGVTIDTLTNAFTPGQWVHLACVYDPYQLSGNIYINGIQQPVIASGISWTTSQAFLNKRFSAVSMGRSVTNFFVGQIDEVRIWLQPRYAAQIHDNMHTSLDSPSGSFWIFDFNEGSGNTSHDKSGISGHYGFASSWTTGVFPNWAVNLPASDVSLTAATLNASISHFDASAVGWFEWGTTTSYGNSTVPQLLGTNGGVDSLSTTLTNLIQGQLYHFRSVVSNDTLAYATDSTFTTTNTFALNFNSANYVTASNSPTFNVSAVTMETWFKWGHSGVVTEFLTSKGLNLLEMQLGGTPGANAVRFIPTSGVFIDTPANSFVPGQWVHFACVYDPAQSLGKIYLNGIQLSVSVSGSLTTPIGTSANPFTLARRVDGSLPFTGQMDEVRVWNVARTASEIQTNMYRTMTGNEPGLIIYYKCDEGIGTSINDSSTNHFIGTFISGASWIASPIFSAATLPATDVDATQVTLNGIANQIGCGTDAWFEWGTTTNYGNVTPKRSLGPTAGSFALSETLTNFTAPLAGHFRLVVTNVPGNSVSFGLDNAFATPGDYALNFDSTNYVAVSNSAAFNLSAVTMETWFKWGHSGAAIEFLASKGLNLLEMHLGGTPGTNSVRFIPTANVFIDTPPNSFIPGQWVHLACVYDPAQSLGKIYLNGIQQPVTVSGSLTTPIGTSANAFTLGRRVNDTFPFTGQMDKLRVWSVVRTTSEIQTNMYRTMTGNEPGLVVSYNSDEGIGTSLNDPSTNHLNGTLINGGNWIAALISSTGDYMLDFNGAGSVSVGNSTAFNLTAVTLEMWFKWGHNGAGAEFLTSKAAELLEIQLGYLGTNALRFIPTPGVYIDTPANAFASGAWVHLACVYDPRLTNQIAKIYLNGIAQTVTTTGNLTTAIGTSASPFILGNRTGGGYPFLGQMDEVRVWNYARSGSEINSQMNNLLVGNEPGLVAYYRFNEATGTNATDRTTNHLDVTLSGGVTWSPSTAPITRLRFGGATVPIAGTTQLQFRGAANSIFILQSSTNLIEWQTTTNLFLDANGVANFSDVNAPNFPSRFFRLKNP